MSTVKSTPRIARGSNVSPDWMHDPARVCLKADEELFYHPEGERGDVRIRRAEAAKAVCRTCPFMDACRQYARDTREPYGTWGGESEAERAKFLSRPEPKPKPKPSKAPEPKPKREPVVRLTAIATDIGNARPRARVDAELVRRHLLALVEAGATRLEIADAAGLTYNSVVEIASGRTKQVTVVTCAALMAVRVAETAVAA